MNNRIFFIFKIVTNIIGHGYKKIYFKDPKLDTSTTALASLKIIFPLLENQKKYIFISLLTITISTLFTLLYPLMIGDIIDLLQKGDFAQQVQYKFLSLLILSLVISLLGAIRFFLINFIGDKLVLALREKIYSKSLYFNANYIDQTTSGELVSRIIKDSEHAKFALGTVLSLGIRNCITLICTLSLMIYINTELALICILISPLFMLPIFYYSKFVAKYSQNSSDALAKYTSLISTTLQSAKLIQAFNKQAWFIRKTNQHGRSFFIILVKALKAKTTMSMMNNLVMLVIALVVAWYASNQILMQMMTLGELSQFAIYGLMAANSFNGISSIYADLAEAAGATNRIQQLLDPQISTSVLTSTDVDIKISQPITIQLKNISFNYPSKKGNPVLEDVNLTVKQGEIVALIGHSGSGKSTIFQLLERYYNPNQGDILINNHSYIDFSMKSWRDFFSFVPQEVTLFPGTIKENIRFGNMQISDQEIFKASKKANAHEFIKSQPMGYLTKINEAGINLSGGQRQRIALARALAKNSPILLLDEATSSLDAKSEFQIQKSLTELSKEKAILVIAHRLSTVLKADKIALLECGKIIDFGTNEDLQKRSKYYSRMINMQLSSN